MPRCPRCRLHVPDCLCAELPSLAHRTDVTLFIHAHELPRPSNTGMLAARVLERARVVVHGRRDPALPAVPSGALVLHPDGRPLAASDRGRAVSLLVPDGSWSQARHMLQRVPVLRDAERVRLPEAASSPLALRRAPRAGHLGTFEALAHALGWLESRELEARMLQVLRAVVERVRLRRRFPHAGRAFASE